MSVKGVLKKKFKLKNPIALLRKKKQKNRHSEPSADTYNQLDGDNEERSTPNTPQINVSGSVVPAKSEHLHKSTDDISVTDAPKPKKKRKSSDNDASNESETPTKKRVTFAADVKSETDQKCTAGNLKPLSLNKRKKINYLKKLKASKKKLKKSQQCEESATSNSVSRQERSIEYLMQWKNDRSNWKFKKIYQLWLIKSTYDMTKISQDIFDVLVEYLQTIEGESRNLILKRATTIVAEFSASNDQQEELNSSQQNKYHRARTIIQTFD